MCQRKILDQFQGQKILVQYSCHFHHNNL
ncbi:hypothetical protein NC653_019487 [Populus alba x Populus x berolinensis]|uniref:Uncharacterized protein n=1 Tax=Populus alba x Populus x berolinensis TaxID=444605 RepID=A0AAD6QJ24_9ROSI|nr:hypothetical protein NC653_019487 [Populus alba x Populus x berolinensis]